MTAAEDRRVVLTDGALALGTLWARSWCDAMRREGRAVTGGWPGTLAEARARVTAYFGAELSRRRMPSISADEVEFAVAQTYQKAKRDWLTFES